ncbi:hypothetical protein [Dyella telluris]|nr:hypothetical protein [Dyella telluris]
MISKWAALLFVGLRAVTTQATSRFAWVQAPDAGQVNRQVL